MAEMNGSGNTEAPEDHIFSTPVSTVVQGDTRMNQRVGILQVELGYISQKSLPPSFLPSPRVESNYAEEFRQNLDPRCPIRSLLVNTSDQPRIKNLQ